MEIITVQKANKWEDSGKISIQDHNGRWLTVGKFCNDADQLLTMQNNSLMVEIKPWTNPQTGQVKLLVNSWKPADGAMPVGPSGPVTPAQQVYVEPFTGQPPLPAAQAPQQAIPAKPAVDRDASIVAQALCKALAGGILKPTEMWLAYNDFYAAYIKWRDAGCPHNVVAVEGVPGPDPTEQQGQPDNDEFNDNIPF